MNKVPVAQYKLRNQAENRKLKSEIQGLCGGHFLMISNIRPKNFVFRRPLVLAIDWPNYFLNSNIKFKIVAQYKKFKCVKSKIKLYKVNFITNFILKEN